MPAIVIFISIYKIITNFISFIHFTSHYRTSVIRCVPLASRSVPSGRNVQR